MGAKVSFWLGSTVALGGEDTHWSTLLLPICYVEPSSWLFVEMSNRFRLL